MVVLENKVCLIMAGGSGTRFWPKSTDASPKQYLCLTSGKSLIQETVDRVKPLFKNENIFICSTKNQSDILKMQVPEITGLIFEPEGKNTAPCLMLSVAKLLKNHYSLDTVMTVLPADHHISDTDAFLDTVTRAQALAVKTQGLITIGIIPTFAHTGFGYIEAGTEIETGLFKVAQFKEKPNYETATQFLKLGGFYWNGGLFTWTLKAIVSAFEKHLSEEWNWVKEQLDLAYPKLKSQPIDIALLEKATNVMVIPAQMGWSDVGSWGALYDLLAKSKTENISLKGENRFFESEGCLAMTEQKIAFVGVKDLIVIENNGTFLICDKKQDQLVKEACLSFKKKP